MPSRERRRDMRVHEVLQDAADRLTANLPDKILISLTREEILYDCTTWSSALTRCRFSGETPRCMLSAEEWKGCAEEEVMELVGEAIDSQSDRWASAHRLGLVRGDLLYDLPPSEMMIDRVLLAMLERRGIDIQRAAERLATDRGNGRYNDAAGIISLRTEHGTIFAEHEGVGAPELRISLPLGEATFDGCLLKIDGGLPQTIVSASPGRSLGEIVGTGIAELDRRIVNTAEVTEGARQGETGGAVSWFELEPDLVKVGNPAGSRPHPSRSSKAPAAMAGVLRHLL